MAARRRRVRAGEARDVEDPPCRRPRRHRDVRFSRRGASGDRLGVGIHCSKPPPPTARRPSCASKQGALLGTTPGARRRGTTVTVEGLFAQVPARRKFLRAARTEWRAIVDALTAVALLRHDVGIRAAARRQAGAGVAARCRRCASVSPPCGVTMRPRAFVSVDDVDGPVRVHGLVEKPSDVGTSARRTWLAVNGRVVRDAGIVRASEAAYRTTLPAGVRPSVLLAVDLPGEDVDVNVHPAKTEVRFRDRWPLERIVERAVGAPLERWKARPGIRVWTSSARVALPADVEALRRPPDGPLFAESTQSADGGGAGGRALAATVPAATRRDDRRSAACAAPAYVDAGGARRWRAAHRPAFRARTRAV